MKKNVIGECPICNDRLVVTKLECEKCHTEISGEFYLSKFNYLSKEQLYFIEVFIKNKGSIKSIEKELNTSYPTVKKYLDEVIKSLGYKVEETSSDSNKNDEVFAKLRSGKITAKEAAKLIKG